jgi:hypothetical protein
VRASPSLPEAIIVREFRLLLAILPIAALLLGSSCDPHDLDFLTNGNSAVNANSNSPAAALELTLGASKTTQIAPGETVTFTANVTGGVPPYTYFWLMDGDGGYTQAGQTFTRVINPAGTSRIRSVTAVVRDATNAESNPASLDVEVQTPLPLVCRDVTGKWATTFGRMDFTINSAGAVVGITENGCFSLVGDLTAGSTGCPACFTLAGTWANGASVSGIALCGADTTGQFEVSVGADLGSFVGRYAYTGDANWRPDLWDGTHVACGP